MNEKARYIQWLWINLNSYILRCEKCGGEMHLYKVVYRNRKGELKEYGGLALFLKKIMVRSNNNYGEEEKKPKETRNKKREETEYHQLCLC